MPCDDRTRDIRTWAAMRLLRVPDPSEADLRAAVRWAERVDEALASAGYGSEPPPGRPERAAETAALIADARQAEAAPTVAPPAAATGRRGRPRAQPGLSAYERLSDQHRAGLDLLRTAYRLMTDREGAAVAWALLAPDAALAERIIAAALADARGATADGRQRADGTNRPTLGRWLSGRRWEDHAPLAPTARGAPTGAAPGAPAGMDPAERRGLIAQANGLRRQIDSLNLRQHPVPAALHAQLAALDARIRGDAV